jgi:Ion channel
MRVRRPSRDFMIRVLDSNASLLVLLAANFFALSLIDDRRWGAFVSVLLAAAALIVAISDPAAGETLDRRQAVAVGIAAASGALVLFVDWGPLVGWTYLVPVILLVAVTLPITIARTLKHRQVTFETVLGALCAYILIGLVFAFFYLAVDDIGADFFSQEGPHQQSEYLYFSFVVLTTLGFGDLSPSVGFPQAVVVSEALIGQIFLVTMVARLVTLWVRAADARN